MTRIKEKLMSRVGPVYIKQIMPGLEGDLEEWQTQEVNVTRGDSSTFS